MDTQDSAIIHPTDFSDLSHNAFTHALRISLAAKCRLYVAHIADRSGASPWGSFPHVRETLACWGFCDASLPIDAVFDRLGIEVAKVEIGSHDPVRGLERFLANHPSELLVLATHARDGMPRWFAPSIAEAMARRARTQTLFISGQCTGFVDSGTGALRLKRILVPVDHTPPPGSAITAIGRFCRALGIVADIRLLHIGSTAPKLSSPKPAGADRWPLELRSGNVLDGILQAAADMDADLIVMATAGHQGALDALRGSTTERVVRQATCPVLAVPFGETA